MGNCYIFNPAGGTLMVTINGVNLGPIPPTDPSLGYAPQSMTVTTTRHDDGDGTIAIADTNFLSFIYQDDPDHLPGPYYIQVCFKGLPVSVDDDIIMYAGRLKGTSAASIVTMNKRGFVLDTTCSPGDTLSLSAAKTARHKPGG